MSPLWSCADRRPGETQARHQLVRWVSPPPFSPPSLTLFGTEIGLSLFCSYREIHSLVLVGLPVAGIAPTP